jgi:multidrug efflux system membrane fusion protein
MKPQVSVIQNVCHLACALLACTLVSACDKAALLPEPLRPVLTHVLGETIAGETISYSGELRSRYETPLAFRIPGKLTARLVDVGTAVKPGDVLAKLDPIDNELSLAAADAQWSLAEAEAKRYRELRNNHFVSQAALDAKETALKAAKVQANLAHNQRAYTVLKADQTGVIGLVAAEPGQIVGAGQMIFQVLRPDTLEVAIAIPETRIHEARKYRQANVSLWADDQAIYKAVLRELSPVADPITRTYAARVAIQNPDGRLAFGMTAKVHFLPSKPDTRLTVPLSAIFQKDGKPALWVVNADQTLALRPVEIAAYGEQFALLAEDEKAGVKVGERIVVAGVQQLTVGEKIRAVEQSAQ